MTPSDIASINSLLLKSKGRCCLCCEQGHAIILAFMELPENGGQAAELNLIPLCHSCAEQSKIRQIPEGQFGTAFSATELKGHKESSLKAIAKLDIALLKAIAKLS